MWSRRSCRTGTWWSLPPAGRVTRLIVDRTHGPGEDGTTDTTLTRPGAPPLRSTATVAAAALLFVAADGPPGGRNDPQAPHEPRSAPGAGQRYLEKFAGDWDVA